MKSKSKQIVKNSNKLTENLILKFIESNENLLNQMFKGNKSIRNSLQDLNDEKHNETENESKK